LLDPPTPYMATAFPRHFTHSTLPEWGARRSPDGVHRRSAIVAYYNFCRVHSSLRVTPAMEAGLTDHVWTIAELLTA